MKKLVLWSVGLFLIFVTGGYFLFSSSFFNYLSDKLSPILSFSALALSCAAFLYSIYTGKRNYDLEVKRDMDKMSDKYNKLVNDSIDEFANLPIKNPDFTSTLNLYNKKRGNFDNYREYVLDGFSQHFSATHFDDFHTYTKFFNALFSKYHNNIVNEQCLRRIIKDKTLMLMMYHLQYFYYLNKDKKLQPDYDNLFESYRSIFTKDEVITSCKRHNPGKPFDINFIDHIYG